MPNAALLKLLSVLLVLTLTPGCSNLLDRITNSFRAREKQSVERVARGWRGGHDSKLLLELGVPTPYRLKNPRAEEETK